MFLYSANCRLFRRRLYVSKALTPKRAAPPKAADPYITKLVFNELDKSLSVVVSVGITALAVVGLRDGVMPAACISILVLLGLLMISGIGYEEETNNVLIVSSAVSMLILVGLEVELFIALLFVVIGNSHAERFCLKLVRS